MYIALSDTKSPGKAVSRKPARKCASRTSKTVLFTAALLILAWPESVWAWGPAAHLHFGVIILGHLQSLTDAVRSLLYAEPSAFLYGCVSADIVLAKRLGRAVTHCHKWANGFRLVETAPNARLAAFAVGYGAHLAADTISHNCFVPAKTVESFDSGVFKHLYWECVFDKRVTTRETSVLFRRIAKGDFADCDEFLSERIPTRIFDFATNKSIFDKLLLIQGLTQWQRLWEGVARSAPWPLLERDVESFSKRSVSAILNVLAERERSAYAAADPTGEARLRVANRLRRHYRRRLSRSEPVEAEAVARAARRLASEPFRQLTLEALSGEQN